MNRSRQQQSKLRFYQPVTKVNVTQYNYEARRGNYEGNTFRRKKKSDCYQLNYSSCLNPFNRSTFNRFDYQKEEFQKKKKIPYASSQLTDPVTLRFQMPDKRVKTRPQFAASALYQHQVEKRFYLPSQRSVSPARRQYYPLMGNSYSLEKSPRPRQSQNSDKLRSTIQYVEANHKVHTVTPKVGQRK